MNKKYEWTITSRHEMLRLRGCNTSLAHDSKFEMEMRMHMGKTGNIHVPFVCVAIYVSIFFQQCIRVSDYTMLLTQYK